MLILKIFIVALTIALSSSLPFHHEVSDFLLSQSPKEAFKAWHTIYNKPYDLNTEFAVDKYKNFRLTFEHIIEVNSQNKTYKLGLNEYSDLSDTEFQSMLLTYKPNESDDIDERTNIPQGVEETNPVYNFDRLASHVDLMDKLKGSDEVSWEHLFDRKANQGACGSCYIFSAVGVVEGFYTKKYGEYVEFSKQLILDCVGKKDGCKGGKESQILTFMVKHGNVFETDFPYKQRKGTCRYWDYNCNQRVTSKVKLLGYEYCKGKNSQKCTDTWFEEKIKNGPISVSLDSSNKDFKSFRSGVFDFTGTECKDTNHAVIMVGLHKDYLIMRNSWNGWGDEKGHGKIKRLYDQQGTCLIFTEGYQPTEVIKLR